MRVTFQHWHGAATILLFNNHYPVWFVNVTNSLSVCVSHFCYLPSCSILNPNPKTFVKLLGRGEGGRGGIKQRAAKPNIYIAILRIPKYHTLAQEPRNLVNYQTWPLIIMRRIATKCCVQKKKKKKYRKKLGRRYRVVN